MKRLRRADGDCPATTPLRRSSEFALSGIADQLSRIGILIALTKDMKRRRALNYALMAAVAAVMGLLLLRAPFRSGSLTADFFSNRYVDGIV